MYPHVPILTSCYLSTNILSHKSKFTIRQGTQFRILNNVLVFHKSPCHSVNIFYYNTLYQSPELYLPSSLRLASGLLLIISESLEHDVISVQSPQVTTFLPNAHCLILHKNWQKGVFTPVSLQPTQFIISWVISTPFSLDYEIFIKGFHEPVYVVKADFINWLFLEFRWNLKVIMKFVFISNVTIDDRIVMVKLFNISRCM